MAKLTDTQLIVLSKAAQREDGAATCPKTLGKAPAAKVAASLIKRKLMREVRAKDAMPVWRTDDDKRCYSLVILRAGRDAIGVEDSEAERGPRIDASDAKTRRSSSKGGSRAAAAATSAALSSQSAGPRAGSKQAEVIAMLLRSGGTTIDELVKATQWLPHTTRAVLSGLRKRGYQLDRQRQDGVTRYRITGSPEAARAA